MHRIGRTGRAGHSGVAITLVDWPDLTRWRVINKALDLDFPEPAETYSTSSHLLTELQIPEDTKGRIAASTPAKDDEEQPTARPHRSQARRVGKDDKKSDRQRRKRVRRRNGEVIERGDRQPPEALPESTA